VRGQHALVRPAGPHWHLRLGPRSVGGTSSRRAGSTSTGPFSNCSTTNASCSQTSRSDNCWDGSLARSTTAPSSFAGRQPMHARFNSFIFSLTSWGIITIASRPRARATRIAASATPRTTRIASEPRSGCIHAHIQRVAAHSPLRSRFGEIWPAAARGLEPAATGGSNRGCSSGGATRVQVAWLPSAAHRHDDTPPGHGSGLPVA
jgi:hypothetical protein